MLQGDYNVHHSIFQPLQDYNLLVLQEHNVSVRESKLHSCFIAAGADALEDSQLCIPSNWTVERQKKSKQGEDEEGERGRICKQV